MTRNASITPAALEHEARRAQLRAARFARELAARLPGIPWDPAGFDEAATIAVLRAVEPWRARALSAGFKTWAYAAVGFALRTEQRRQRRQWGMTQVEYDAGCSGEYLPPVSTDAPGFVAVDPAPGPEAQAIARVNARALRVALGGLDERLQRLLRLRYWDCLRDIDLGREMGLGRTHLFRLQRRAFAMLRERLA